MMSLSILNDFCSWWWLWWIAPFLLGLMFGATLWRKHLRKARELEESLARHKSTIHGLEGDLNKAKRDLVQCDVGLEKLKKENKNLVQKHQQLQSKIDKASASAGPILTPPVTSTQQDISTNPTNSGSSDTYSKLQPTNLQIIEGIGPKLESILKSNGINNWKQLSSKSKGELKAILDKYDGKFSMIDSSTWPKQAFKAMNRDWDGLIKFQKASGAGSKVLKILKRLGL